MSRVDYDPGSVEERWSREWVDKGIFDADVDPSRPKIFITFPYPYMNGSLHLGHAYSAGRLDVLARYYRMKGFNVLYPWAWHWTGEAVMGVVHRLEAGDESIRERLVNLDGVEPEELDRFRDPVYLVRYFTRKGKEDIIRLGLSIDWRREFHTTNIHPLYTKFVEWQIRRLYEKGYIVQEPHPVVWCPRDESPTGDHDRLEGVGVRPEEYILVKFYVDALEAYLVAGTFRPETIFGVTNIWVKPGAKYVLASVDGERWIVSSRAVVKLRDQLRKVDVIREFNGDELIGLRAVAPYVNREVPVLPAEFVDPDLVTGVVYSVPAHAPYDYAALMDLKRDIDRLPNEVRDIVAGLEPISIIHIDGYSEYPARDAAEKYGVSSQLDRDGLEKATRDVYSDEYHKGVMKDNCLDLSGVPVREAKDGIVRILTDMDMATTMYDLPERVVCRCGTVTHVKIIEDQWALKYSDEGWKELARQAVREMNFYPEELRKMFLHYIDWYEDWPCTRRTGLGTPFPYDREWIVETLTDSTIYMAFYIIAKYYNMGKIDPSKVDDDFFNYVFYGVGDVDAVAAKSGVPRELLESIRNEFLYWYPVDIRGSGKDLVGNHLTFFIFHHVALFGRSHWPRGISVNGYIKLEGKPMSKSTGNFISLRKAIETYGSDAVRIGLLTITDGLEDPDVRLNNFWVIRERLRSFPRLVSELLSKAVDREGDDFFDKLLLARFSRLIDDVESLIEAHKIAAAGRIIFYQMPGILNEYMHYVDVPSRYVVEVAVDAWVRLLSLYAPFVAEEIWRNILGREGYVALQEWPRIDVGAQGELLISLGDYAEELLSDIEGIVKLVVRGEGAFKVIIIPADRERWRLVREALARDGMVDIKEFINLAMDAGIDRSEAASIYKLLKRLSYGRYTKLKRLVKDYGYEEELSFLRDVFPRIVRRRYPEAVVEVLVGDVPNKYFNKVSRSMPLTPAIIIEPL